MTKLRRPGLYEQQRGGHPLNSPPSLNHVAEDLAPGKERRSVLKSGAALGCIQGRGKRWKKEFEVVVAGPLMATCWAR